MAITHFEIKQLPDPNFVISKIGVSALVIDTLYPIAQQTDLNFERHADLDGLYVAEAFIWKTHNQVDSAVSNDAAGQIIWRTTNTGLAPLSSNVIQLMTKSATVRLIDLLPINEATEFIEILNVSGVLNFKLNGVAIVPGQRISVQDLIYSNFTSNDQGGGDPYAILTYDVGKKNLLEGQSYTLTLNVDSVAELTTYTGKYYIEYLDGFDLPPLTFYNVREENMIIQITEGYQNGIAEVEFIIASPFLALNIWNRVFIDNAGTIIEKSVDETFTLNVQLDVNGRAEVSVRHYIVEDTAVAKIGQLDMTLKKINGDAGLVSLVNFTEQLLTNY